MYDTLTLRIIDCLGSDSEELEEVYLHVNFERSDNTFQLYAQRYRLIEVLRCLQRCELDGLLCVSKMRGTTELDGFAAYEYHLTDKGRVVFDRNVKASVPLYD